MLEPSTDKVYTLKRDPGRVFVNIVMMFIVLLIGLFGTVGQVIYASDVNPDAPSIPWYIQVVIIGIGIAFTFLCIRWSLSMIVGLSVQVTSRGVTFPAWSRTREVQWDDITDAKYAPSHIVLYTMRGAVKINFVAFKEPDKFIEILAEHINKTTVT